MNCTTCGTPLNDGTQFCPGCGAPAPSISPAAQVQPAQQYQQPYGQYQQPYGQPQQPSQQYQQPGQEAWPPQPPVSRALAMAMYWSLLGWLFALIVCDKSDPFIRHHLNNVTVIIIGSFICGLLMIILIGFIGLIFLMVVTIIGTISAYHGDMKPLPLISKINIIK